MGTLVEAAALAQIRTGEGRSLLLFDGDCGICSRLARTAASIDRLRRFRIEPYQAFEESELRTVGLSHERCDRAVQLVDAEGGVRGGAFAVNGFLLAYRKFWLPVGLLYVLPPLLLLEMLGYAVVARNRHRISAWLGLDACKIAS